MSCSRSSSSVCEYSRAVTDTSCPRARSRSITGLNTSTWAGAVMSIQTLIRDRPSMRPTPLGAAHGGCARDCGARNRGFARGRGLPTAAAASAALRRLRPRPGGCPRRPRLRLCCGGFARGVRGYPRGMAPSERTRRAAGLDGLRAVAALSVLCFHAWLYGFDDPSAVARNSFFDRAMFEMRLGLVFFFVLSGYLLYRGFA